MMKNKPANLLYCWDNSDFFLLFVNYKKTHQFSSVIFVTICMGKGRTPKPFFFARISAFSIYCLSELVCCPKYKASLYFFGRILCGPITLITPSTKVSFIPGTSFNLFDNPNSYSHSQFHSLFYLFIESVFSFFNCITLFFNFLPFVITLFMNQILSSFIYWINHIQSNLHFSLFPSK